MCDMWVCEPIVLMLMLLSLIYIQYYSVEIQALFKRFFMISHDHHSRQVH